MLRNFFHLNILMSPFERNETSACQCQILHRASNCHSIQYDSFYIQCYSTSKKKPIILLDPNVTILVYHIKSMRYDPHLHHQHDPRNQLH